MQRVIVDHNGDAIARQTHVEFNPISAGCDRGFKSSESILRRHRRRTAMSDYEW